MLGGLPIAGMKDDVDKLIGTLNKTTCGGGLTGCFATKSGKLQLYFVTHKDAQETFLLVLHDWMALPPLLKPNVQKVLGGAALSDPIISISTTDYVLDLAHMPADLQQIVQPATSTCRAWSFRPACSCKNNGGDSATLNARNRLPISRRGNGL